MRVIWLFFLVGLMGCGSARETGTLVGLWRLQSVSGGFAGGTRTISGEETLALVGGEAHWKYEDGRQAHWLYTLSTSPYGEQLLTLSSPEDGTPRFEVKEQGESRLVLQDYRVADGFTYTFVRQQ